ncbi:MAG: hypothetical protein A2W91_11365 [Bacteroidetes bacterium GWF2_38_335]|nr:MAG: hypothetical protein A2W91_11365 [Bacteroidetes bacterium GWF2_38_335]OFY81704.1 MAG: hypothetical protein A2281_05675 [Bacteroidetes bacterium RIFOXYA12_FULL_38_20]HBS87768.1 hypothetical protein [Bacteroidales bacterium]
MKRFFIIYFGILILSTGKICSQTVDSVYKTSFSKNYFKSFLLDTRDIALSPLHWDYKEYAGAALTGGAILYVTSRDLQIHNYFMEQESEKNDKIAEKYLEPWGSGLYSMSTMGLFYLYGVSFKNDRAKRVAMLGAKTFLISGLFAAIPKILFNRYRPYNGKSPDPGMWMGPFAPDFYRSFPSGHTTSIFSVATIVASEYQNTVWVPVLCYSIATASGLSRIYSNDHWLSDVMCGAAFGIAMGKLIYNSNNWKLSINPYSGRNNTGLMLSFKL